MAEVNPLTRGSLIFVPQANSRLGHRTTLDGYVFMFLNRRRSSVE